MSGPKRVNLTDSNGLLFASVVIKISLFQKHRILRNNAKNTYVTYRDY
jgi:hypothetical protein